MADRYKMNLTECADLLGISTETLRGYVNKAVVNGFPVEQHGGNGVSYVIDARAAAEWWKRNKGEALRAKDARAEDLFQMRLELFGVDADEDEAARLHLSGKQRREEFQAEREQLRLMRDKGQLLLKSHVEDTLAAALTSLRQDLLAVPINVAKRLSLNRGKRQVVDDIVRAALHRAADRLKALPDQSEEKPGG